MKIKHLCLFSGTGGPRIALNRIDYLDVETIGYSDIDKAAIDFHKLNHPGTKLLGDVTKIDETTLPDFDLLTGGFPCQSFSIAGKREGFAAQDKGNLFFDIIRIAKHKKPKYMLLENVRGLTNHDNGETLNVVIRELKRIGYGVAYKILNSKDYGTPQNRERMWFACKFGGWDFLEFNFPYKEKLNITMQDILEPKKDIKKNYNNFEYFYITDEQYKKTVLESKIRGRNLLRQINNKIAYCLTTGGDKRHLHDGNIIIHNLAPRSGDPKQGGTGHLSRDDGISYCLDTSKTEFIESANIKPRILTPKERFRLMGFKDFEYNIDGLSYTACNNLTGNGWDIDVAEKIFRQIFKNDFL